MKTQFPPFACGRRSRSFGFVPAFTLSLAVLFASGCGGGNNSGGSGKTFTGNTTVVVFASSTANDQLFQFSTGLSNLTLTPQSGPVISLFSSPVGEEFIHLNGRVEPIATVSIPQGTYTSASVILSGAFPACAGQTPGTLLIDEALGGLNGITSASIPLPQPITVTGSLMGLVLNMDVSKTAPFTGGCSQSLTNSVTITPTFTLTPISIADQPTNSSNGKIVGVEGLISSASSDGSGFTAGALVSLNEGGTPPSWQVAVDSSTTFQGVKDSSALAAGMPVDMDLVVQPDGSLLATRVAVYDSNTANLSIAYGPLESIYASGGFQGVYPMINTLEVEQNGDMSSLWGLYDSLNNATYQVSGQLTNLNSLPFTAAFNFANMVDGQNVFFSTHASIQNAPQSISTLTLLPQTIDGTVTATSSEGGFTTYTVTLAPYDLFPILAVQAGQTTRLTTPDTIVVYADGNTQMLTSGSVSVGNPFRFYGLVFNDQGALRMDCAQINDGVPE